jgi:hypothetical protein
MSLRQVWDQKAVPVVLRRTGKGERLRVRLPFDEANETWLRNRRHRLPQWDNAKQYWELPKAWFNDFVNRARERYGSVYIIQPYREQEVCAPACQNAEGHECQCSCMGQYHGVGNDGSWFEVTDAFATRWGDTELACRFLKRRDKDNS